MMKRLICLFCALTLCTGLLRTECAAAVIEPDHSCSLTLSYSQGETAFPGLKIDIYRVAGLDGRGSYTLIFPFSSFPIRIHGITSQQEWQETAQTIRNFVAAEQIPAYQTQTTDTDGFAAFTGLETGLYMVKGTTAQNGNSTVIFRDFMVYLPTPVDGGYDYDMEAKPKWTEYAPPTRYTAVKLWKDAEASGQRPKSVQVEILKDGTVQETVTLSSANNWSYSWDVPDGSGEWSVMEPDVPEGYQVSITNYQTTFTITNTKTPSPPPDDPHDPPDDPDDPPDDPYDPPDDPDDPPDDPHDPPDDPDDPPDDPEPPVEPAPDIPKTGDTAPLLRYAILMCVSGFGLMLLGALNLKRQKR